MLTACLELEEEIPNFDEYRKQPIYKYVPHELVIHPGPDGKNMSIYSYDQALPPVDLLRMCDKMYPIGEDNAKDDTEKASKKSRNYQADSVEDMTSGKGVIDLHDQKTKQRLFNAIDSILSGDDFALDDEYFEPAEKVDTGSQAYQVL